MQAHSLGLQASVFLGPMLCGFWVWRILWLTQAATKVGGSTDRLAAPLSAKHRPEGWDAAFQLLAPPIDGKILSATKHADLTSIQHLYYFAGSGKMKSCNFEPDALGSLRIFVAGKVRMQFFAASDINDSLAGGRDKSKEFVKDCEDHVGKVLGPGGDHSKLTCSRRFLVDASSGPIAVLIPPGFLIVQEALDAVSSVGLRRSFSPVITIFNLQFSICDGFRLKGLVLGKTKS